MIGVHRHTHYLRLYHTHAANVLALLKLMFTLRNTVQDVVRMYEMTERFCQLTKTYLSIARL